MIRAMPLLVLLEQLSFAVFEEMGVRESFARLTVNGEYWGHDFDAAVAQVRA